METFSLPVLPVDWSVYKHISRKGMETRYSVTWDVDKGIQIQTLEGHLGQVTSISFSPDGKTLASAGVDKTVRLWNLERDPDNLIGRGCLWLRDYLTTHPEEEAIREICL